MLISTVLLSVSTGMIILFFSFDALAQATTIKEWVKALASKKGADGFVVYFLFENLLGELFCYFAVIKTVS
jgi:hypothetical protein